MNEDSFQPFVKFRALTLSDFLSNIGGFMGLMAGVSVLSLVEFFYFLVNGLINRKKVAAHDQLRREANQVTGNSQKHGFSHMYTHFVEFMKSSDMHGLKYAQGQTRIRCEKMSWTLLVTLSITICSILIKNMNEHAEKLPVVIKIDPEVWTLDDVRNISLNKKLFMMSRCRFHSLQSWFVLTWMLTWSVLIRIA